MIRRSRPVLLLVVSLAVARATAFGQPHPSHEGAGTSGSASAILLATRATPTATRRHLTEGYLTQPIVNATVAPLGGRVSAHAMLNLEGVTLQRGELNSGTYGEGFVDRRHPHSYVHELVVTAQHGVALAGRAAMLSITAGRGFAPFGSDDPMSRPFVKYPVNHHLAQLLERLVVATAARVGAVTLEAGVFNGDEPTSPSAGPAWSRFGDSWSGRATVSPAVGVEIAASVASVTSPEAREGGGLDHRKGSIVARVVRPFAGDGSVYLLAEWARTDEDRQGRVAFTFTSALAEGAICRGQRWMAARLERTVRPEEERLIDPFRSPRPHIEVAILGRSRWTVTTVAAGTTMRSGVLSVAPFAEASLASAANVEPRAALNVREFYGSNRLWLLSVGARVKLGSHAHRMGRYGAAAPGRTLLASRPVPAC